MNGISLLADTNVFINLAEDKGNAQAYLQNNTIYASVISELELLGFHNISSKEYKFFEILLQNCTVVELIRPIKEKVISIRRSTKIKLPDAIIVATAMYLNIPLLTYDKGLSRIKNIDLIIPEL
ncbi:MAG: type II toxin-antitoxin system VapC family toxin [Bacteroidetes bacterium]|nr:type II toxin-antitoxin system VapC family toxin [Bacteroidota bacterium]